MVEYKSSKTLEDLLYVCEGVTVLDILLIQLGRPSFFFTSTNSDDQELTEGSMTPCSNHSLI